MIVTISDNFNLEKIMISGQCFRAVSDNKGNFSFVHKDKVLHIKNISATVENNTQTQKFKTDCTPNQWKHIWEPYFNLEKEYSSITPDTSDTYLTAAANFSEGIRILRQDPWETLVSFIISQRKSIPSIIKSVKMLSKFFGQEIGQDALGHAEFCFPSSEEIFHAGKTKAGQALLDQCKLGYRLPYVLDAARAINCGDVNLKHAEKLNDAQLIDYLCQVKGVGVKVANCVALFAYGRHDCAPVDTWINKIINSYYNGKNPFVGSNAGIFQQYAFYYEKHKA